MGLRLITHVVPVLPSQIDGVGDYALNLAKHLREQDGINSRFIVCDPNWDGPSRLDDFIVRRLRVRNEACLWGLLSAIREHPAVLLHYVGYGYHNRGIPFWLYRGIKSWLSEPGVRGSKRFFTVFHELWACGKPWQSAFYLRSLQRWLVQQFHRRSEVSVTSTHRMQGLLDEILPGKTLCMPIPSNIPMSDRVRTSCQHKQGLQLAIFGQQRLRTSSVQAHANLLRTLADRQMLESTLVMGKGLRPNAEPSPDVLSLQRCVGRERVRVMGELPAAEVGRVLNNADLLLSPYRAELACKSGALMAALASGCPAVLRDAENASPLREGEHFVASDDTEPSIHRLITMAGNGDLLRLAVSARTWYELNADWKTIVRKYGETFRGSAHPGAQDVAGKPASTRTAPTPPPLPSDRWLGKTQSV